MKITIKNTWIYIVAITVLSSCGFANFSAIPGSKQNTFPKELQGKYMAIHNDKNIKDTVYLDILEKKSITTDLTLKDLITLSDSTTLSHLGVFYFFNIRVQDSTMKNSWTVFPIYLKDNNLYLYSIPLGKQSKKLSKYLNQDTNGTFVMDNEPFKKYCEKYLRKKKFRKKASKLQKIK